jgi:hypothetical protein
MHGQQNCGKTGADKLIIRQSHGDVKGAGSSWTGVTRKGGAESFQLSAISQNHISSRAIRGQLTADG